ncbi:MAG: hypothetical protein MI748_14715 [Opitutales bacterium]|nr:hypothetical protein [Opitutales bacterium]
MSTKHKFTFWILATLLTGAIPLAHTSPIEISNSGLIDIDQGSGVLKIDGGVDIHQSPFYLTSESVVWDQTQHLLEAIGNVILSISPKEAEDQDLTGFTSLGVSSPQNTELQKILESEHISYRTDLKLVEPIGASQLQLGVARIIADELQYSLEDQSIKTGRYRIGMNNLFLEGSSLEAKEKTIQATNAQFFLGEPEKLSIQGSAKEVLKQSDESVILKGVWLKIGSVPFFYLPRYYHDMEKSKYSFSAGAGYSGDIGSYLELRPTYRIAGDVRIFGDVNFYSERGILVGPGFELEAKPNGHEIKSTLETGYINDNGNLGVDILGNPIDSSRHFVDFEYIHKIPGNVQILSKLQWWSDSEVLRDFDTGKFHRLQQPENFLEFSWISGSWAMSHSAKFRHEDFEFATEQLPRVQAHLLPSPIVNSGFYHSATVEGALLRNRNPNQIQDLEYNRFRAFYELNRPLALSPWLDFIPKTSAQALHYDKIEAGHVSNTNRQHYEVGFDLNAHLFAQWDLQNEIWGIKGIRHLMTPTIQYRNVSIETEAGSAFTPIESRVFRTGLDDIDLSSNNHLDDLSSYSLLRVGLMNKVITKKGDSSVRELLQFDVFHDHYFQNNNPLINDSLVVANVELSPAYWLKLDLQSRFNTDSFELNDLFGRLQLVDGDIWDLDISTQFLKEEFQQYLLEFRYKIAENLRFVSVVGLDAEESRLFEQTYGLQLGVANYWDILFSVSQRDGSTRNNETRFEFKIIPARF